MLSAGPVQRLLKVVCGKNTKNKRDVVVKVQLCDPHGNSLTNVVEMRGVTLDYATDAYHCVGYELLCNNLKRLSQARDARGRQLDIIEMDVLPYAKGPGGKPLAIPYTNAYVINGAVIAPQVDPQLDEIGYRILEQAMPGRSIVPVPSYWQAVGGGGIGCITQQVPVAR